MPAHRGHSTCRTLSARDLARSLRRTCSVVGLAEKVNALSRDAIESIETHMSWVFLTEQHAYKLKKPVRYEYLDFSTIEKRRIDCELEVTLNRRLAPDVYLGTLPLTADGKIVDWVVWMRRLPSDRTLEVGIARKSVTSEEIRPAAEKLARFYRDAPSLALVDPVERIAEVLSRNRRELVSHGAERAKIDRAILPILRWLERGAALFEGRRIVDAHGDLRPEHIFLLDPPAIIDCIEFNQRFRELDPVSDLSFLFLECERLGAPEIGTAFLEIHRAIAHDDPDPRLVDLYAAVHAGTRARLALWHLAEPNRRPPQSYRDKATEYLELAAVHAARLAR